MATLYHTHTTPLFLSCNSINLEAVFGRIVCRHKSLRHQQLFFVFLIRRFWWCHNFPRHSQVCNCRSEKALGYRGDRNALIYPPASFSNKCFFFNFRSLSWILFEKRVNILDVKNLKRLWIKTRVSWFTLYQLKRIRRKQKRVGWNRTVTPTGFLYSFDWWGLARSCCSWWYRRHITDGKDERSDEGLKGPWRCVHDPFFPRKLHREFVRVMVVGDGAIKMGEVGGYTALGTGVINDPYCVDVRNGVLTFPLLLLPVSLWLMAPFVVFVIGPPPSMWFARFV